MGKVLFFKDIVSDLERSPRDVTIFGEKDFVTTEKSSYDLYYCYIEGIGHDINLDSKYSPIPVFQYSGDFPKVAGKIKTYHEIYGSNYAIVCNHNRFEMLTFRRIECGLEVVPDQAFGTVERADFMEVMKLNHEGFEDIEERIDGKIQEIESQAVFKRLAGRI